MGTIVERHTKRGEILGLEWERISFAHRSIQLIETKNGTPRGVRSFSSRYSAKSFGVRAVSLYAPRRLVIAATRLLSLLPLRFVGEISSR